MRKCSLCGGKLDSKKRCTLCGLDNTKNDEQYKAMPNRSSCDGKKLTHVHQESREQQPIPRQETQPKMEQRPKAEQQKTAQTQQKKANNQASRQYQASPVNYRPVQMNAAKPKSGAKTVKKVLVILLLVFVVIPIVVLVIAGVVFGIREARYEEEVMYENYLEPGMYTVGVHIPEGEYRIELDTGDYGFLEVLEYDSGVAYLNESYYMSEDDEDMIEEIYLYEGEVLVISSEMNVRLTSTYIAFWALEGAENPLSDSYELPEAQVLTAGVDFPAGVYDIIYTPTDLYEDEYGDVYYMIWNEEHQLVVLDTYQYFDGYMGERAFRNLEMTEGSQIWSVDLENVTLVPSEIVDPDTVELYSIE